MIGISKLYCGAVEPADVLRYNRLSQMLPSELLQFSRDKKPVVVWNCTRTCNLRCVHCYAHSDARRYEGELTTEEAKAMIDDLATFGSPVLLFSGGEPCLRPDLVELMGYAKAAGMRVVISTNGTMITPEAAHHHVGLVPDCQQGGISCIDCHDAVKALARKVRHVEFGGTYQGACRHLLLPLLRVACAPTRGRWDSNGNTWKGAGKTPQVFARPALAFLLEYHASGLDDRGPACRYEESPGFEGQDAS